jgi:hypothetical protein
MQPMWTVKTKVILVIIGGNRTFSVSIRRYLNNILRKHEMKDLQETAILRHCTHT